MRLNREMRRFKMEDLPSRRGDRDDQKSAILTLVDDIHDGSTTGCSRSAFKTSKNMNANRSPRRKSRLTHAAVTRCFKMPFVGKENSARGLTLSFDELMVGGLQG